MRAARAAWAAQRAKQRQQRHREAEEAVKPRSREWYAQRCFESAALELLALRRLQEAGVVPAKYLKGVYTDMARFYTRKGVMFRTTTLTAAQIIRRKDLRPW